MKHDFDSADACIETMVNKIRADLATAIAATGRAGLAVSGGRSPVPLFDALSNTEFAWQQVDISLVDERFVPPGHPDSNESLVRNHLLQRRARCARFSGLVSDSSNIENSVEKANLQTGEITVALLGMGDDGHFASLFPGAAQLSQGLDTAQTQRYIHVTPTHAPHERISMTLAALLGAHRLMLYFNGQGKRAILEEAEAGPTPSLPVSYLLAQHAVPLDIYWHE